MDFIVFLLVGTAVVGLLSRRWISVFVPLISVPLYIVGIDQEWWGCCGTGDGWQAALVLLTAVGMAATGLAVFVGRLVAGLLRRGRDRPAKPRQA